MIEDEKVSLLKDYLSVNQVVALINKGEGIQRLRTYVCESERDWYNKARKHFRLFLTEHPDYQVREIKPWLAEEAYNSVDWGRMKNKGYGRLSYEASVEKVYARTKYYSSVSNRYANHFAAYNRRTKKYYSWVSNRYANYFAAYNRYTNILYYELPGDKKPYKLNLFRKFKDLDKRVQLFAINEEINIEKKRELISLYGEENYMEACEAKIIHEDVDSQGGKRQLMRLNNYGGYTPNGNKSLLVIKVTCPSTGRIYFLKPPKQSSITCQEAVNSTFRLYGAVGTFAYRHGDIALRLTTERINIPFSES